MSFLSIFNNMYAMAANAICSWFGSLLEFNSDLNDDLFDNTAVSAFLSLTLTIGTMLFVAGIAFAFANWAIDSRDGSADTILSTFKNIAIGLGAVSCYTTVPVLLFQFTNYICNLVVGDLSTYSILAQISDYDFDIMSVFSNITGIMVLYIIIMFFVLAKIFFANIKRGGILLTLMFVGSLHMFSIPRGYCDAFWGWCKQVVGLCITAFCQNFLFALSLLIEGTTSTPELSTLIVSLGVALSASEVPRILQQFGLDTSMKANVSQAIFAVSGVSNIVKSFI